MEKIIQEVKNQAKENHLPFNSLTHFLFLIDGVKYFFSFSGCGSEYHFKKHYLNDRTGFVATFEVLSYLLLNDLVSTPYRKINIAKELGENLFEASEVFFMVDNSYKAPTLPPLSNEQLQEAKTEKADQLNDILKKFASGELETKSETKGVMKKMKTTKAQQQIEKLITEVKEGIFNPETLKYFAIKTSRTCYSFSRINKNLKKVYFVRNCTLLGMEFEVLERIIEKGLISTKENKVDLPYAWGKAKNWYFMYDASYVKAEALEKAREAKEAKRLEEKAKAEAEEKAKAEEKRLKRQAWETDLKTTIANMKTNSFITFLISVFMDVLGSTSPAFAELQVKKIVALHEMIKLEKCEEAKYELCGILYRENKASRTVFEQWSGLKLPRTEKGTRAVVESIFNDNTSELEVSKKYVLSSEKNSKASGKKEPKAAHEEYVYDLNNLIKVNATPYKHKLVNREFFVAKVNGRWGIYDKLCGMLIDSTFKTKKELIDNIENNLERHEKLYENHVALVSEKEQKFAQDLKMQLGIDNIIEEANRKFEAQEVEEYQNIEATPEATEVPDTVENKIDIIVVSEAPEVSEPKAAPETQETEEAPETQETEEAQEETPEKIEATEKADLKVNKRKSRLNDEYVRFSEGNIIKVKASPFSIEGIERELFIAKVEGKYGLYDKSCGILLGRTASFKTKTALIAYIKTMHEKIKNMFINQKGHVIDLEEAFKKELYDYKVKNEPDSIEAYAEKFKKLYSEFTQNNDTEEAQEVAQATPEATQEETPEEVSEGFEGLQEAQEVSQSTQVCPEEHETYEGKKYIPEAPELEAVQETQEEKVNIVVVNETPDIIKRNNYIPEAPEVSEPEVTEEVLQKSQEGRCIYTKINQKKNNIRIRSALYYEDKNFLKQHRLYRLIHKPLNELFKAVPEAFEFCHEANHKDTPNSIPEGIQGWNRVHRKIMCKHYCKIDNDIIYGSNREKSHILTQSEKNINRFRDDLKNKFVSVVKKLAPPPYLKHFELKKYTPNWNAFNSS